MIMSVAEAQKLSVAGPQWRAAGEQALYDALDRLVDARLASEINDRIGSICKYETEQTLYLSSHQIDGFLRSIGIVVITEDSGSHPLAGTFSVREKFEPHWKEFGFDLINGWDKSYDTPPCYLPELIESLAKIVENKMVTLGYKVSNSVGIRVKPRCTIAESLQGDMTISWT
jgi:hypothetical protein